MDTLYLEQINFLLTTPKGVKCLLFDNENTKQMINNLIEFKKLLDADYFYFDYLTNKKRSKVNINAVVILNNENLKLLINELVDPLYSTYTIMFKNRIDPFALEILASADRNGVISHVFEINMVGLKIDDYLYTSQFTDLITVFQSLDIKPDIYITKNHINKNIEQLIQSVTTGSKHGNLLFLERNFDLITPLLSNWHYQSAIHQYLNYNNETVKIDDNLYKIDDEFFQANKFYDIETVGDNIKKLVKDLEKKRFNISNHQFENIEHVTTQSKIIDTHMNIFKKVIDSSMRNKEIGELEIQILKGIPIDLSLIKPNQKDMLKIQLLLSLYKNSKDPNLNHKVYDVFVNTFKPASVGYKYSFNNNTDLLSYEPPIKRIFKHFVKKTLNSNYFVKINNFTEKTSNSDQNIFIIYIEGGITFREYRDIILYAKELGVVVYLFSNKIINCNDILNCVTTQLNNKF